MFNCHELAKSSQQHQGRSTSQGRIWKKQQQVTAFRADPGRQSVYAKQADYKSQILRTAPKQAIKITLGADGPWVKSTWQTHVRPRTQTLCKAKQEFLAQATGRCRLNSPEEGGVGAPWAWSKAVKEGRRQEALDAMVMGRVQRPTQTGRNHVASSYFWSGWQLFMHPQ